MLVRAVLASFVLAAMPVTSPAAERELFPFVVSYDSPENATNLSAWLERPAGKHGFVRADSGRFATDAGPIRFWATNLCFDGCFPSREQAERLAARLARLGINCVRMHHMDSHSIWGKSPNKLTIDPEKLDRLDYLIYQLKQHGVYTNLNLHVSRSFGEVEGFTARDKRPTYDKGLDNFEPRMIELQKKYARDLLLHVNPYTKTAYAQEPAVACVEINNENALYAQWGWGELDQLPEPYAGTFRSLWNAWLTKKYGATEALRKAWNASIVPLGEELFKDGDFSQPLGSVWQIERDDPSQADWSIQPGGPNGKRLLRVVTNRPGQVAWHPQLTQGGFAVKKDFPYTLVFQMRSDKKRRIHVNCMQAHDPWLQLGFSSAAELESDWKTFRYTFTLTQDDANARISFTGLEQGTYELAGVSLRPGGVVGLEPDQRLENQSVPVLRRSSLHLTSPARHDFCDFLWDTEAKYWWEMHRFLKEDLHVRPPVSGTQIGYSPAHVQAKLDYIDAHAYWQHPDFPGRPWDPANWNVHNIAMVNTPGGTLSGLAATRILGMPYTVSEYNHAQPLRHAAEGFLMIAAFGAFQGWDGICSFAYAHGNNYELNRLDGFFDIRSDPSRIVHMPACAAMFLRGDVVPAKTVLAASLSPEAERRKLHETQNAWTLTTGSFGLEPKLSLLHAIGLDLKAKGDRAPAESPQLPKDAKVFVSDTGQLRWDASQSGAGYFTADTPRTKFFTGFIRGREFTLGDVKLRVGKTRLDWASVSMTALDGAEIGRQGRVLIAATGWVQNKDMKFEQLGDDRLTVRTHWGTAPVLCEGIPAEIALPVEADRVTVYPLDAAGNRRESVQPGNKDGKAVVRIGPEHKTLWYEVEIR